MVPIHSSRRPHLMAEISAHDSKGPPGSLFLTLPSLSPSFPLSFSGDGMPVNHSFTRPYSSSGNGLVEEQTDHITVRMQQVPSTRLCDDDEEILRLRQWQRERERKRGRERWSPIAPQLTPEAKTVGYTGRRGDSIKVDSAEVSLNAISQEKGRKRLSCSKRVPLVKSNVLD